MVRQIWGIPRWVPTTHQVTPLLAAAVLVASSVSPDAADAPGPEPTSSPCRTTTSSPPIHSLPVPWRDPAPARPTPNLPEFGTLAGSAEVFGWGFQANRNPPRLRTHDRFGHRIDEVEFHPAWHRLLDLAVSRGLHSLPWEAVGGRSWSGQRSPTCAPGRGGSLVPDLDDHGGGSDAPPQPDIAAEWEPRLLFRTYDASPPPEKKAGVLVGMGMTEKQGGSDVRSNTDRGGPGRRRWSGRDTSSPGTSGSPRRR